MFFSLTASCTKFTEPDKSDVGDIPEVEGEEGWTDSSIFSLVHSN